MTTNIADFVGKSDCTRLILVRQKILNIYNNFVTQLNNMLQLYSVVWLCCFHVLKRTYDYVMPTRDLIKQVRGVYTGCVA